MKAQLKKNYTNHPALNEATQSAIDAANSFMSNIRAAK